MPSAVAGRAGLVFSGPASATECVTGPVLELTHPVAGQIFLHGAPVVDADVIVSGERGVVLSTVTDGRGYFETSPLDPGRYWIAVGQQGLSPVRVTANVSGPFFDRDRSDPGAHRRSEALTSGREPASLRARSPLGTSRVPVRRPVLRCWALAPLALSAILDVRPAVFPAYDSYQGIARYAPTPADYAAAVNDRRFVMERLTYRSDGLDVYAYLYRPAKPPGNANMPVVVFNRGSYVRDDFSPEVLMPGRRLAEQGYLVIAPMLRGSGGAPGHDEMGGADLHDLLNIVPVVKALPYADPDRMFLYGESRGGIMCLLAAKAGFPARAMAVYGAITDLGTYLAEDGPARGLGPTIWPGFPANEAEIVESRSALRWPDKIGIPVLIMNGGEDAGVSPLHALRLATALEKLQRPYELKIFYGEKHVLAGRARERDDDAMRWFRRFDRP